MSLIDMQLLLVLSLSLFFYSSSYLSKKSLISTRRRLLFEQRALYEQILQQWNNPPKPKPRDPPTETEELISYVNYKPWRAPKVKYLKKHYKPWSASWQERFRTSEDDVIYIYTIKNNRELYECTRGIDMYAWPFLWTRNKIDRHAWIQKCFDSDITAMTVQDHMELDAFHSEFDMPLRWCMFRLYEAVELNSLVLYLVLFFDFYGIAPTDRGLRPDLTLKTCPVQFHQCISSSNSPLDTEHYAPPFKWSRTKSPDQAITEIKNIYENYPKRGLKWASGWIDRGGWYPQQFNGNYFYAQGRSLIWHYTDDIELLINPDSREVSFRSSARLGQTDNDVQRLRYNQFVRMLAANKDWEVQELPLLHYEWNIVRTWAQHFLDDQVRQVDRLTDTVLTRLQLQTVTLPSLPSLPSFPLPQETWLSKLDDVENSLSSFWKPLMMSDGLNAAVEEKVVQIEQFLHSFDRHDEITSQEERKEDRTSSLIIPNTQLTTSSDVAPTASTSSSITPVEERKRVRNFKEVKQEFKKEVRRLDREDFFKRFSDSSNDNDKAYIDDNDLSDQMEEDEVDKKIGEGRRGKKLIEPLFSSSFSSYKSKLSAKARHYPQYS